MRDLSNVSVGDVVIVDSGGFGSVEHLQRVEKVLSRHIVVGGLKYRKEGGYKVGDGAWHRGHIRAGTKEELEAVAAKIKRVRIENFVSSVKWRDVCDEKLEAIYNLLKPEST